MNKLSGFVFCTILTSFSLQAQITGDSNNSKFNWDTTPFQLTHNQWGKIQYQWKHSNYIFDCILNEGDTVRGQLLTHTDSTILLWTNPHSFLNALSEKDLIRTINYHEIQKLFLTDNFFNRKGILRGMLAGGLTGTILGSALTIAVTGWISPLVLILPVIGTGIGGGAGELLSKKITVSQIYPAQPDGNREETIPGINKYCIIPSSHDAHLFLSSDNYTNSSEGALHEIEKLSPLIRKVFHKPLVYVSVRISKLHYPLDQTSNIYWDYRPLRNLRGIIAGYNFTEKSSLELSWDNNRDYFPIIFINSSTYLFDESINFNSTSVWYFFRPFSGNKLYLRHIQPGLGIGASMNKINSSGYGFLYTSDSARLYNEDYFKVMDKFTLPGINLKASCDFFLSRRISLFASLEKSFTGNHTIPAYKKPHTVTNEMIGPDSRPVNLSAWKTQFGVRIHLFRKRYKA